MIKFLVKVFLTFTLISSKLFGQGFICAVGGGSEHIGGWSDKPYGWIVEKADSGKIVILSYQQETDFLPEYFVSLGASSAENLAIDDRLTADEQSTYDQITEAAALFIKGGDQSEYITLWKETKTHKAIIEVFDEGGVIAGTSAGAMLLSEITFTAENGTVYSDEALLNPDTTYIQLSDEFLTFVPGTVFDTHFIQRGRIGRLVGFILNRKANYSQEIMGIGIDDKTALCIDSNGTAEVFGTGAVTFLHSDNDTQIEVSEESYSVDNLRNDRLTEGFKFDLDSRTVTQIPPSAVEVDTGNVLEYPITNLFLTGTNKVEYNVNHNLAELLSEVEPEKLVVIYNNGYEDSAAKIMNYLTLEGYNFKSTAINSENIDSTQIADIIGEATSYIICGDEFGTIKRLGDSSFTVGKAFIKNVKRNNPAIIFFGNIGKTAGEYWVNNVDDEPYASYDGELRIEEGIGIFRDLVFQPLLYNDFDFFENRTTSVFWGLMRKRKKIGVYLTNNARVIINSDEQTIEHYGEMPLMIVDARHCTWVDSSKYLVSGGINPRNAPALVNLRMHFSKRKKVYSLRQGSLLEVTNFEQLTKSTPGNFFLSNNYPNPFNPSTQFKFGIPANSDVKLTVYNILGQEVSVLLDSELSPGIYSLKFHTEELSSGVYFYSLQYGDLRETKKMLLLR